MAKRNKEKEIQKIKRKEKPLMTVRMEPSNQNIELKVKRETIKRLEKLQPKANQKREIENLEIKKIMNKKMVNRPKTDQMSQNIESKEKRHKKKAKKAKKMRKKTAKIKNKKKSQKEKRISFTEILSISRKRRSSSQSGKSITTATGNVDPVRPSSPWKQRFQKLVQQFQSQQKLTIGRKSKILMIELRKLTKTLMAKKLNLTRFLKRNINIDQDKMTKQLKEKMMLQLNQ
jgi:hypothetical protein